MFRRDTIQLIVAIALMAVTATVAAQNKVVVIPLGGDEAPTSKAVFITDQLFTGNLDGPTGADDICQDEADNLPGSEVKGKKFKAWISGGLATDFTENGRVFIRSELPYKLVDGTQIAGSYTELIATGVSTGIEKTAAGIEPVWVAFPSQGWDLVWTGIAQTGDASGDTCNGWVDDSGLYDGLIGRSNDNAGAWTGASSVDCGSSPGGRLYCFEQ